MQRINISLSRTGLLMAALLICLYFIAEWFNLGLAYSRPAISRGVFWPAITGHFVHLSIPHLLINAVATYLIIDAFESGLYRWRLPIVMVLLCIIISAGLYYFYPGLKYYYGLSGVLHGLTLVGAAWCSRYPDWVRWVIIGGVIAKVGWEQSPYYDESHIARMIGGPVAEQAHLLGAVGGILIVVGARITRAFR
ncbi:rhombosortase [Hahella sp. CCB-MM4]|nr:rhombosortase [Hahella sp. CCB-MM4]